MKISEYNFSGKKVSYYFDASFTQLAQLTTKEDAVLITDENVFAAHAEKFEGWRTIIINAGEQYKQQSTVDTIIQQLIALEAGRNTLIVGVGGGVVTDIAGYVAGVYLRGVGVGFVPTTILGMVDAAIGGKNGVDVGLYKNLVGLIRQPEFLLFDIDMLSTLPREEWINGFAEIIKHAAIKDAALFAHLQDNTIEIFQQDKELLSNLIERNVTIKMNIVVNDEQETGERKLLNFGHTFGHAIENTNQLPHGHAVSIGMAIAAIISEEINNFYSDGKQKLIMLLNKYQLPTHFAFDKQHTITLLKMDKKRVANGINFILLNSIGDAVVKYISFTQLEDIINQNL